MQSSTIMARAKFHNIVHSPISITVHKNCVRKITILNIMDPLVRPPSPVTLSSELIVVTSFKYNNLLCYILHCHKINILTTLILSHNDKPSDEITITGIRLAQMTDFSPSKCTWLAETIFGLISAAADIVYLCVAWRQVIATGFRRVNSDRFPECDLLLCGGCSRVVS